MNLFLMYSKGLSETMAISCDTISTCSSPHIVNQITSEWCTVPSSVSSVVDSIFDCIMVSSYCE